jgi:uncharacterized OB-fold protein
MTVLSSPPSVGELEIPIDKWTEPFWDATAEHRLSVPQCAVCGTFRWPPGPFCPTCQSQELTWVPAGTPRLYSYTIIKAKQPDGGERMLVPALVEFPEAGGVRLLAAIVGAAREDLRIGAALAPDWVTAANAEVPTFTLLP